MDKLFYHSEKTLKIGLLIGVLTILIVNLFSCTDFDCNKQLPKGFSIGIDEDFYYHIKVGDSYLKNGNETNYILSKEPEIVFYDSCAAKLFIEMSFIK